MTVRNILLVVASCIYSGSRLYAQEIKEASKEPPPGSLQAEMMALAKASQNPLANMNSVPFQFNWYTGGGLGNQTMSQTLVQPVLPLPLNKDLIIVSRTVVPIMSLPTVNGDKLKGIADIQEQIYLSPAQAKGLIWGFGPVLSLPTATISSIATGQFAVGPSAIFVAMPGKFVVGAVINQMWRIGGSNITTPINQFYTQPFANYNFNLGWSLIVAPGITANWSAPSGQQWTVPIGGGVSKITVIGKQPINLSFQYYHNAVHPDNAGTDQVRMVVVLLFPKKM